MSENQTFVPLSDEGQAGWVLLPDGRRAYRSDGSDELIIHMEVMLRRLARVRKTMLLRRMKLQK